MGLVGIILSTMGLKCIKFGTKTDEAKGKTMVIGGIIFIIAGKQKYIVQMNMQFLLLFSCLHVSTYLASIIIEKYVYIHRSLHYGGCILVRYTDCSRIQ